MKKTQNVREGTRKGGFRRKKELALALAVSLWMAGGGVAGAEKIYIDANETLHVEGGAAPTVPVHNGKYLTITDGTWTNWYIYGGYSTASGVELDGYHLTLSKVQNMGDVWGANANTVTGNTLNLSGANNIVNVGSGGDTDYYGGKVKNFENINIKGATWGTSVLKLNGAGIVQNTNGEWAAIDASKLKFANPETIPSGATMNLIEWRSCSDVPSLPRWGATCRWHVAGTGEAGG